jgi:DNA/RNA endonuclease G (NUC1)
VGAFEEALAAFVATAQEAWSKRSEAEQTAFTSEIAPGARAMPRLDRNLLQRARERAALSGGFAPLALLAGWKVADRAPLLDAIATESDRTLMGDEWHWTLRSDRRERVITELAQSGRLGEALADAAQVDTDAAGRQLREVLAAAAVPKSAPDPGSSLTHSPASERVPEAIERHHIALQELVQALTWAAPVRRDDAALYRVRQRARIAGKLAEFERLTRGFVGRECELARLKTFIETDEPPNGPIPVLTIAGIGGSGKSTLLAQALKPLLESHNERATSPILVAIDFDRLLFRVGGDLELSFEVTQQLGLAVPAAAIEFEQLREQTRAARTERGEHLAASSVSLEGVIRSSYEFQYRASDIVRRHGLALQEVILILDTFEEWQREQLASRDDPVQRVVEWLTALKSQMGLERLSVVLGGRAPVSMQYAQLMFEPPIELGDLAPAEAEQLLRGRGVPAELAASLAAAAGGNPLVLQLAAHHFLALPPAEQTAFLADAGSGMAALDAVLRQGFLYDRFLRHVADEQVRKLAHPGLALRRVTKDLVRRVLAQPCGLGTIDDETARTLVEKLGREVWLVTGTGDELQHRPDVRRAMLKMMQSDPLQADRVRAIHWAAADWYERQQDEHVRGEDAQVEALYHQLASREPDTDLPEAWLDRQSSKPERLTFLKRVGQLGTAIQEFPPRIAAQVAFAQGLTITEDTWLYLPRKHQFRWLEERGVSLMQDGSAAHALTLYETYAAGRAVSEEPWWLAQVYFETARWEEYRINPYTQRRGRQKYRLLNAYFADNTDGLGVVTSQLYRSLRRRADKVQHNVDSVSAQQDLFVLFLLRSRRPEDAAIDNALRRLVRALRDAPWDDPQSTTGSPEPYQAVLTPVDRCRGFLLWPERALAKVASAEKSLIGLFRPDPRWLREIAAAGELPDDHGVLQLAEALETLRGGRSILPPEPIRQLLRQTNSANLLDSWARAFADALTSDRWWEELFGPLGRLQHAPHLLRADNPELRPMARGALADAFRDPGDFRALAKLAGTVLPVVPADFKVEKFAAESLQYPMQLRIKLVEYVDRSGVLRPFLEAARAVRPESRLLQRVTDAVVAWDNAFQQIIEDRDKALQQIIEDRMAKRHQSKSLPVSGPTPGRKGRKGRRAKAKSSFSAGDAKTRIGNSTVKQGQTVSLVAAGAIAGLEGTRVKAESPFSAEQLKSRRGHAVDFLGKDLQLPLPPAGANEVWLHYTHFSILMDRKRRQPRMTIVDIDGALWRQITRAKGDDIWYPDPRLGKEDQPEKDFFQKPDPDFNNQKNDFAFGQMVRRIDPTWAETGDDEAAERAEQETFHLTNASPQAASLNSKTWNRLESIVLDDLKKTLKIRAVVLTGPVMQADDPKLHGTFLIPRQYWKVVAWRADDDLAAVGWRQKQPDDVLPLTLESLQMPFDNEASEAWLIPIADIASLTGLDLSPYVAADTFRLRRAQEGLEAAAAEPIAMRGSAAQLLLTDVLAPDDTLPRLLGLPPEGVRAMRSALAEREAAQLTAEESGAALETLGPESMGLQISPAAYDLIVRHETGGRAYYETVIKKRPVWPKYKSGITIGFGYDLGYVTRAEFERDWAFLPPAERDLLAAAVGKHGGNRGAVEMKSELARVKHIVVEWPVAEGVFKAATLPKFIRATTSALPNCDRLSSECFGALVSLTFNRGAAYAKTHDPTKDPNDNYREMRAIKTAMQAGEFSRIPGLFREMRRVWQGTAIEKEMNRRRENEAALFEAGLLRPAPETILVVAAGVPLECMVAPSDIAQSLIPAGASVWEGLADEDFWTDVGEDELAELATSGPVLESAATVSWPSDEDSPDYAHVAPIRTSSATFMLTSADLELLARLNEFPVGEAGDTPILFGLRGCGILRDHTYSPNEVVLKDQRPDHRTARCVMGVWNPASGTVQVFPGSTVPNEAAVIKWRQTKKAGNLLPTGLYRYIVGPHATLRRDGTFNSRPGCFLLRESSSKKRVVVVRRSSDDLRYDLGDMIQRAAPGDNIHPTFFSTPISFSSFGCQTVVGTADRTGKHTGPWAQFRQAAGMSTPAGTPGKPFLYMLLTGAEAALASDLRQKGLVTDPPSLRPLRRLRFGSRGAAVGRLQATLNLPNPDSDLGPFTAETLYAFQRAVPPKTRSDGIWSPDYDSAFGFGVFGSIGT